jgi:purine-nucleoside phosphorylase
MKPQEFPIHIKCEKNDIAPNVLMPGDPLRAKYIAEKFLENAKLVTSVRNMFGYTGTYKGVPVTIMGSGMGMPSMSIYAFELFYYYDVKKVIRIGTCGVVTPDIKVPEIIVAKDVYSLSNFAYNYDRSETNIEYPSSKLTEKIIKVAKEQNKKVRYGTVLTCDAFGPYINMDNVLNRIPSNIHPIAEEMEAYALMHVATSFNRDAAAIVTAVDSKFSDVVLSVEDRERSLDDMILLALDSII